LYSKSILKQNNQIHSQIDGHCGMRTSQTIKVQLHKTSVKSKWVAPLPVNNLTRVTFNLPTTVG